MTKLVPAAAIACLTGWWISGDWPWLLAMASVSAIVAWTMTLMKESTIVPLMEAEETTKADVVDLVATFCALAHPRFAFAIAACGISLGQVIAPTLLGEPLQWLAVATTGILAGEMAWVEAVGCITASKLSAEHGEALAAMMASWWPSGVVITSSVAVVAIVLNAAAAVMGMATMPMANLVCHVTAALLLFGVVVTTHVTMAPTASSIASLARKQPKNPPLSAMVGRFHSQHAQRLGCGLAAFLLVLLPNAA